MRSNRCLYILSLKRRKFAVHGRRARCLDRPGGRVERCVLLVVVVAVAQTRNPGRPIVKTSSCFQNHTHDLPRYAPVASEIWIESSAVQWTAGASWFAGARRTPSRRGFAVFVEVEGWPTQGSDKQVRLCTLYNNNLQLRAVPSFVCIRWPVPLEVSIPAPIPCRKDNALSQPNQMMGWWQYGIQARIFWPSNHTYIFPSVTKWRAKTR